MFPVDFLRLTIDTWRLTLEGFSYRIMARNPDQPCIYCRGCDLDEVPRPMHAKIKYWNLWMLRLLRFDLEFLEATGQVRKVAVCRNELGYIYTPFYLPVLALFLTGVWVVFGCWFAMILGLVPADVLKQVSDHLQ